MTRDDITAEIRRARLELEALENGYTKYGITKDLAANRIHRLRVDIAELEEKQGRDRDEFTVTHDFTLISPPVVLEFLTILCSI